LKFLYRLTFHFLGKLMLFISRPGAIGLAPKHTQPGDEVLLIPTCERPIFLRPQDGKHLVLEGSSCITDGGHIEEYISISQKGKR
jgi:hypothetical protein